MPWRERFAVLAIVAAFPCYSAAQTQYFRVSEDVVQHRLATAQKKNKDREAAIGQLFVEAGCSDHMTMEPVRGADGPNVICILPGSSAEEIVVGAHYDKVPDGDGVVDNWSGAALLSSLYESLCHVPRKHTYVFIAFSGEERGLLGSASYVKQHKPELSRISAMVNMDSMGLGPTEVWQSQADKSLIRAAIVINLATKIPVSAMDVDHIGTTDSESFHEKKVPSITFHTITPKTWHLLHSSADRITAIDQKAYYQNYEFLATFTAYLDERNP